MTTSSLKTEPRIKVENNEFLLQITHMQNGKS